MGAKRPLRLIYVFNVLLKTHSPTKKDKRVKAKNMCLICDKIVSKNIAYWDKDQMF